jgi:dTDP-L-rhamnose 4-epimerase
MNITVTGGAGFIGRSLVSLLLERGHDVTVIDALTPAVHGHDPDLPEEITDHSRLVVGDIRDATVWDRLPDAQRPDVVVHFAAETGVGQSMIEIERYVDVNLRGSAVMLEALRDRWGEFGHLVLASSRAVYGEGTYRCGSCGLVTPPPRVERELLSGHWEPQCPVCGRSIESVPTHESAVPAPSSVYAMTKAGQEDLLGVVAPTLGATTAVLRYSNVYGEGQPLTNPYTGVLSAFALRIVQGKPPTVYEDGVASRDFVHVRDVARATAAAVERHGDLVVNVGSGMRTSLNEIAHALVETMNPEVGVPIVTGQYRIGDIRHFVADVSGAREALDFEPAIGLREGLARFGEWVARDARLPDDDVASRAERELSDRGLGGRGARE